MSTSGATNTPNMYTLIYQEVAAIYPEPLPSFAVLAYFFDIYTYASPQSLKSLSEAWNVFYSNNPTLVVPNAQYNRFAIAYDGLTSDCKEALINHMTQLFFHSRDYPARVAALYHMLTAPDLMLYSQSLPTYTPYGSSTNYLPAYAAQISTPAAAAAEEAAQPPSTSENNPKRMLKDFKFK